MKRIQRKRTKGWRLPPGAVCVTRPGKWGNPYKVGSIDPVTGKVYDVERSLKHYEGLMRQTALWEVRKMMREELGGKDLACYCPLDKPCHADIILAILADDSLRRYDEWREAQAAELKRLTAMLRESR